ncbi:MAG: helix-turn-helix domain-containing protein [Phycisphaerae bacterium]|nr:helix-turn-helix domain-containing protein [Phycisphaerae bacterium]
MKPEPNGQLLSLPVLAQTLNLPKAWIRAEADAGRLPHLRIGRRYRFNLEVVLRALLVRAGQVEEGRP